MPLLKFSGGPWDGVEFDAALAPNTIHLRDLQGATVPGDKPGTHKMKFARREHHVYMMQSGDDDDGTWYGYEYVPDGKPWWDKESSEQKRKP